VDIIPERHPVNPGRRRRPDDLEAWAAKYSASPAVTETDRRHRAIVADLLRQATGR
jgi:hypothetical protein